MLANALRYAFFDTDAVIEQAHKDMSVADIFKARAGGGGARRARVCLGRAAAAVGALFSLPLSSPPPSLPPKPFPTPATPSQHSTKPF